MANDGTLLSVTSPGKFDRDVGPRLSDAPDLPPDALRPARKHMQDLMSRDRPSLGADAANPFVRKMDSLKAIELGIRDAVSADPGLAGAMAQLLQAAQLAILGSMTQGAPAVGPAPMIPSLPPPGLAGGGPPAPPSPLPGPAVMPMPAPGT